MGETKRSQLGCESWKKKGTESGPGETQATITMALFAALHGLQKSIYFVSNQSLLMLEILLPIISHSIALCNLSDFSLSLYLNAIYN